MDIKKILKRIVPVAFAGAAMLVLAMPMSAMAHDWDHHDNGRHMGWFHRDHDDDDCGFRGRQAFYPRDYYQAPQYRMPYGYGGGYGGGYGLNNPRMNFLEQKFARAEAMHQNAVANGNRRAAKISSQRLYQLDREMGVNGRYAGSRYGYGYGQNGSALGNLLGLW